MTLGTMTPTRVDFDLEIDERRDDDLSDYEQGWFCVQTKPFPCPVVGCDFVALHMTAAHLIIVWGRKDDADLLELANDACRLGRDPRVVPYESSLGPCISYWAWVRAGGPVHGRNPRPGHLPYKSF